MGKVKELPYQQGYTAAKEGKRSNTNPYWEKFEEGYEWAFHSWLNGWTDYRQLQEAKQYDKPK